MALKPSDREIMTMLDKAAVSYQAVLTKGDKPKSGDLAKVMRETEAELRKHPAAHPVVLATSAVEGLGIEEFARPSPSFAERPATGPYAKT